MRHKAKKVAEWVIFMKPRQTKTISQKDLFQPQLVDIIDPNHPLVRLAKVIDWNQLDNELGGHFSTVIPPKNNSNK